MGKINRRQFMKKAIVAGTTMAAFPAVMPGTAQADKAPRVVVHPNVNNLRVVGVADPKMTTAYKPVSSWTVQDQLVSREAVWRNLDKLAGGLAEVGNSTQAWQRIFIKPPGKTWAETTVAVKTNNIGKQHTRSAVMSKVCHTLTDTLGVQPANISIYDACHGKNIDKKTDFVGLPENCRIENTWGGSTTKTAIPGPWKDGTGSAKCLAHLVDGSVDILVNVAMCKGHSDKFGGFTMTMKNHFGAFDPWPGHMWGGSEYILSINKTKEILGEMEPGSDRLLFPRQQLCIIDALWASECGPGCVSSHQPNFLAMGVLSPVLDYVVATRFRGEQMGWQPNMEMVSRMLSEFGYEKSDLDFGGKIVAV
ncbi:MAG: hypothetical protein [Olavius algarvensis Delta 4 endosymbiont]|nr:MAG: hypothetical protein [Olavius algarvensis Delta 4 endosymbiont]